MQGMYSMRSPAVKRLMKEAQELREPTEQYECHPLEDNLFEWHFTIRGPADTEFEGGLYHGRIILPPEYPMKPPSIILLTNNGRFETNKKICLSISGHHPETWQPSWSLRTALLAIIGFMPTHGAGALGSLEYTADERKMLAKKSLQFKCSSCGCVGGTLKPVTEESKKTTEEARELAAQIDFKNEKETKAAIKSTDSTKPDQTAETTTTTQEDTIPDPLSTPQQTTPQQAFPSAAPNFPQMPFPQFPFRLPFPPPPFPPQMNMTGLQGGSGNMPVNPAAHVPRFPLPFVSPFYPPMPAMMMPPGAFPTFPPMMPGMQVPSATPHNLMTSSMHGQQNVVTSAQNAATSAQNVVTSAQNGVTLAQNVVTSAQNAATSAQNVVTSAQNGVTLAQNVVTSAQNAATSAQNAATSAQNVATSLPNVVTSAQNVVTSAPNVITPEPSEATSTQESENSTGPTDNAADSAITDNVENLHSEETTAENQSTTTESQSTRPDMSSSQEGLRQRNITRPTPSHVTVAPPTGHATTRGSGRSITSCDIALSVFTVFVVTIIILLIVRRLHMMNLFDYST